MKEEEIDSVVYIAEYEEYPSKAATKFKKVKRKKPRVVVSKIKQIKKQLELKK